MEDMDDAVKRDKDEAAQDTDAWGHINEVIAVYKDEALRVSGTVAKADLISELVAHLLVSHFIYIESARPLLQRVQAEDISFNMALDALGDYGIYLGACAYRLAEQLESEIPEENHRPTKPVIRSYMDGHEMPDEFSAGIPVSLAYRRYFLQHPLSVFLQSGYWLERILTSDRDDAEKELARMFFSAHIECTDDNLMIFIHSCLRKAYADGFSTQDVETLREFRDRYKARRENQREVLSTSDYADLVLMTASLTTALDRIEQTMTTANRTNDQ